MASQLSALQASFVATAKAAPSSPAQHAPSTVSRSVGLSGCGPATPLRAAGFGKAQKRVSPRTLIRAQAAPTMTSTKIEITPPGPGAIEALATLAPWTLEGCAPDAAVPNKSWTLWVCEPAEFPWVYSTDEYAYILTGAFYVTYEGEEAVLIKAGDFVHFSPGTTMFKVVEPVRKFYHLV